MESQENQYRWPKAEAVYPDRPGRSYALKRLRYRLRSFLHRGSIAHFEQFINQHPFLATLLNEHADYSYPLVYRFLDKRFNSKQRFEAICDNLLFLPEKLTALSASIYKTPLSFGEVIPDFEMTLSMTTHQPMEGYWVLELWHKPRNELVYLLTFAKLGEALLISVVQGPNFEGSKEMVKQLTKTCHGLRPAYLMVETMKAFITVIGHDTVGVVAKVAGLCTELNINIEDVTQSILQGMFAMIMLVDVSSCSMDFTAFAEKMKQKGDELGVDVRCTRQEIYDAMHRI